MRALTKLDLLHVARLFENKIPPFFFCHEFPHSSGVVYLCASGQPISPFLSKYRLMLRVICLWLCSLKISFLNMVWKVHL